MAAWSAAIGNGQAPLLDHDDLELLEADPAWADMRGRIRDLLADGTSRARIDRVATLADEIAAQRERDGAPTGLTSAWRAAATATRALPAAPAGGGEPPAKTTINAWLANDDDHHVRTAVARHPRTDRATLEQLTDDPNETVATAAREALAGRNPEP